MLNVKLFLFKFQLTPPIRAATDLYITAWENQHISTHATHKGGDYMLLRNVYIASKFQLTPPIRAATISCHITYCKRYISTHATHKGGDRNDSTPQRKRGIISTHATHKGGDQHRAKRRKLELLFQLTPPIRAATNSRINVHKRNKHFNSHHPCGWRPCMDCRFE